jgi:hypothetical protein
MAGHKSGPDPKVSLDVLRLLFRQREKWTPDEFSNAIFSATGVRFSRPHACRLLIKIKKGPMKFADKKFYDDAVAKAIKDKDIMAKGSIAFADRWVTYMEAKIATGDKLADIAHGCKEIALATDHVTGVMQLCAAVLLWNCWEYSEEFEQWWNKDMGRPELKGKLAQNSFVSL